MTNKLNGFASTAARNAAIIAMARDDPDLPMRAIGEKFGGLTAAAISLILSGKRGSRGLERIRKIEHVQGELEAIGAVTAVLAPLSTAARRRVVEYAIEWLASGERLKETVPAEPPG